ncbi:hypothetical protein BUALT_Bualt05G0134000 [Buddleja alternifolia]|uniref:DDE Tnp4 domain-containing protein n=1 Tax=Buddleja alternifolia TaxID=168488 RepID=A0AAV6XS34_9LAMI|nr:hypothetical protein BUALT_Bualt05G0134000 [Buddleja alternifolia]
MTLKILQRRRNMLKRFSTEVSVNPPNSTFILLCKPTNMMVLRDAISRANGLKVSTGQYYLCDNGYMNCLGFLAPYRGVRYHLDEWAQGCHAPQDQKKLFNQRHSKVRNIIERTWGIMKWRCAVLRSTTFYPLRTQNRMILACALLHNFIRCEMEVDPGKAQIHENHREFYNDDHPAEVEYVATIDPSNEWGVWRDNLAGEMFKEWRGDR